LREAERELWRRSLQLVSYTVLHLRVSASIRYLTLTPEKGLVMFLLTLLTAVVEDLQVVVAETGL
jgi:hypothetical protein